MGFQMEGCTAKNQLSFLQCHLEDQAHLSAANVPQYLSEILFLLESRDMAMAHENVSLTNNISIVKTYFFFCCESQSGPHGAFSKTDGPL